MSCKLTRQSFPLPVLTLTLLGTVVAVVAILPPQTAHALPVYAQQTGLPCGQCHIDPRGGGPRTAFGRAFAAHGHELPPGMRRYDQFRNGRGYGSGYGPGMMGRDGPGMMGGYGR